MHRARTVQRGRALPFSVAPAPTLARLLIIGIALGAMLGCRGPAEDKVCQHMLEVLGRTDVVRCSNNMATVRERLGVLRYRAYARCILRASTSRDIVLCRSNLE
jgi:hypothetical protein